MTDIEKAIKHFKCVYDGAKAVLDSGFGKEPDQSPLLYERRKLYAKLAIEALEKQIPKKGIMIGDNYSSILSCPNCRKPIVNVWNIAKYEPNYCHYCGQSLDWSDTE